MAKVRTRVRSAPACSLRNSAPARQRALSLHRTTDAMVAPLDAKGDTVMNTNLIQNADILDTSAIADAELDTVTGGKVTYYEMNGHWYIVGHNKYGQSTGAQKVT